MTLYGNMDLDADTVIRAHDSRTKAEVQITLGVQGDPEQLTLSADDPDTLDRLANIVTHGARVLRMKRPDAGTGG